MGTSLDHTIVTCKNVPATIKFYTEVMGFEYAGPMSHFEVIRINEGLTFDLVHGQSDTIVHYAFEMDKQTFEATFERIQKAGIPYGGSPFGKDKKAPGVSLGSRGRAHTVYCSDPSGHSIEIRCYKYTRP